MQYLMTIIDQLLLSAIFVHQTAFSAVLVTIFVPPILAYECILKCGMACHLTDTIS